MDDKACLLFKKRYIYVQKLLYFYSVTKAVIEPFIMEQIFESVDRVLKKQTKAI